MLVGIGLLIAFLTDGWERRWDGPPAEHPDEQDRRGPGGLVFIVGGVLLVGGVATALAYRRISRPVGDLLGAAGKVTEGDYDIDVTPGGPRELRLLVTTFNDMAKRLAENDEQRRRFLADITHELRTPLAVLQSEVEAQLDGIHPRDDQHLASLLEEIHRLGRLVEDLHTLALAEAGRIVLHRELVSPVALVEDAIEAHAALAQQKDVEIRLLLPAPASGGPDITAAALPEIDVDPTRARQVLDNLLSNAVRHTPSGSEVVVTVEPDVALPDDRRAAGSVPPDTGPPGDRTPSWVPPGAGPPGSTGPSPLTGPLPTPGPQIRFTVTDAGPGFPPDQLDQVFERFVRSADSRGSGLGLSIARDLVQAHGGTIAARNNPDGGASVTFTLPSPA